jgi:peptidylprolyl isomerase
MIFLESVQKGDKIKVEYVGTLDDGTIFDSSEHHEAPLEFIVGTGQIIKGFDEAVIGMKIGDEKQIKIPPEDAYGPHLTDLVKEMPRNCFPEDQDIQVGMMFMISLQDGRQIPVKIYSVSEETITIDANHPLAGQTLTFKLKLLEIVLKIKEKEG